MVGSISLYFKNIAFMIQKKIHLTCKTDGFIVFLFIAVIEIDHQKETGVIEFLYKHTHLKIPYSKIVSTLHNLNTLHFLLANSVFIVNNLIITIAIRIGSTPSIHMQMIPNNYKLNRTWYIVNMFDAFNACKTLDTFSHSPSTKSHC